jgi:hypothetical protein
MECMSSGLTDWAMRAAAENPDLIAWLQRMHARLESYPTLYSRRMIDVQSGPLGPGIVGQTWFFLWMILWPVLLPVSLPVLAYAFIRRKAVSHRSGARLQALRKARQKSR